MDGRAQSLFPMLTCADLAASLRFYGGVLGGRQTYRYPAEGDPEFIVLRIGTSDLGLGPVAEQPLHGRAERPTSGHRVGLCVYVDDVDDTVDALRRAGATVVVEPTDQPWGERMAYVEDPDGTLVMLATPAR